jgi:hypothetical protein
MKQKGSEHPNLEVFGANPLPFSQYLAQIRSPSQAILSGVLGAFRRQRTSSEVEQSDASDLSSAAG